ncbi:MAG: hypothetical protein HYW47_00415 [Deltaproteobacteria bacterium]|nr:hypothetical protein [Deltaproteobacteria bacterium]
MRFLLSFILIFSIHSLSYAGIELDIEELSSLILDWRTTGQERVSDEIFDAIGTQNFKVSLNDYVSGIGTVRRRFFDNRDGSYTIVDIFDVQGRVVFSQPISTQYGIDFTIGSEIGRRYAHTFTVDNKDKLLQFEKWKEKRSHQTKWEKVYTVFSPNNWFGVKSLFQGVGHLLDEIAILLGVLSQDRARYTNYWKQVTIPFDLPYTAQTLVDDIQVNELFSFTTYGGIFSTLGLGVPGGLIALGSIGVYIRDEFRISVLKSAPKKAKVKVQKIWSKTFSKGSSGKYPLFDYKVTAFDLSTTVKFAQKPFEMTVAQSRADAFDQAYEYDLENPDGIKAYDLAMQRDFITSEQYANEGRGVKKILKRKVESKYDLSKNNLDVILFKKTNQLELSSHWHKDPDNNDKAQFLQTITQYSDKSHNLFTHSDLVNFTLSGQVDIDENGFGYNPNLIIKINFNSEKTRGYEVRSFLAQLPEPIVKKYRTLFHPYEYYGKTNTHYEIRFSTDAINNIIQTPNDVLQHVFQIVFEDEISQLEKSLHDSVYVEIQGEKIFDIRRYLKHKEVKEGLKDIKERLLQLKNKPNVQEKMLSLTKAFSYPTLQFSLLQLFTILASRENTYQEFGIAGKDILSIHKTWGREINSSPYEETLNQGREFEEGPQKINRSVITEAVLYKNNKESPLTLNFKTNVSGENIQKLYIKVQKIKTLADITVYESNRFGHSLLSQELFSIQGDVVSLNFEQEGFNLKEIFEEEGLYAIHFAYLTKEEVWSEEKTLEFVFHDVLNPQ